MGANSADPVMKDVRVVEVSEWGAAPAAAAILADWGAEVVKIEHPLRGDPMRGLVAAGGRSTEADGYNYFPIAAGIAAALYRRAVTGRGGTVDVSLLSLAVWAIAPDVLSADLFEGKDSFESTSLGGNPLVGPYATSDGRAVMLTMPQSDRHWPAVCRAIAREELVQDSRYESAAARAANADSLRQLLSAAFASRPLAEWQDRLAREDCVFEAMRSPLEVARDPQVHANGYLPRHPSHPLGRVAASPVQFDGRPLSVERGAPETGQHTEEILLELGLGWPDIGRLKGAGAVS